jgi:SAM-dependent methyltransferase
MTSRTPEIFSTFQCSFCGAGNPQWFSVNHADHLFGSPGKLICSGCGKEFPVQNGYLNVYPVPQEPVVPFQAMMQIRPLVAVYEATWRPLGYFIGCKRSLPKDIDKIATLIHGPKHMILDLACGPGNVTRRIARLMPHATVIGLDLSHEMLERAVKVTQKEGLRNVYYMRGTAMSIPFKAGTFDAVSCCGALQLFRPEDEAMAQIARILKPGGEFVCQTTIGPRRPPLYVRIADRVLKFGYFYLDDLKERLFRFNFSVVQEERSKINYIFLAAKSGE